MVLTGAWQSGFPATPKLRFMRRVRLLGAMDASPTSKVAAAEILIGVSNSCLS
jgi:hypothetical protein